VPDEFHDETLLASNETLSFSLLAMSAKLMVFNVMKPFIKSPLRLVLTKADNLDNKFSRDSV